MPRSRRGRDARDGGAPLAPLRALAAIVGMALGVVLIASFAEAAIGEAQAWWQWLIGAAVAGALGFLGGALIYAGASAALDPVAAAYLAWLEGRPVPGARGAALASDLAVFSIAGVAGAWLYRTGVADGEDRWAAAGALFVLGALLLGLVPALPHALGRAAPRERSAPRRPLTSSPVAALATAAMIGMALAMALASALRVAGAADGDVRLAPADWAESCVAASGTACPTGARLRMAPTGGWTRVEAITRCPLAIKREDGVAVATVSDADLRGGGVAPGDGAADRRRWVFLAEPNARYDVWISPIAEGACRYSVRFLPEPIWRGAP